jgi:hypothetical protein
MRRCSTCGAEHELLDPTFKRPEPYLRLARDLRDSHAKADDDLCRISPPGDEPRFFVRGVLPVSVTGHADGVWWGVWAEVSEASFARILALWSDADQDAEPPMRGALANAIPSYPDTLGLPLSIQLIGPTSRPQFRFEAGAEHPFVSECRAGVDAHRAAEWNELFEHGQGRSP